MKRYKMILVIKHIGVEGPGVITDFFQTKGYAFKEIELSRGGLLPQIIDNINAVVILGGPMNVYDEEKHPFLKEEDVFIKKIIDSGIPLLGICLGAQLIAKAAGARVYKATHKEMGWHKVDLTPEAKDDPLFKQLSSPINAFQWHEDKFDLPANAVLLAQSNICPQAFRLGRSIYGLQFHFEVTPQMVKEWIRYYSKHQDIENVSSMIDFIVKNEQKKSAYFKQADIILTAFEQLIYCNLESGA